ncbi:MAG TPA: ABC transporter ATP-binding protein [Candidatus Sumerlaeota bacterium]|mgnify:CR=1 FL=1|nr:ABC transporter ATP-binding protein [Candidatus Sumerlaeota bacterium]
MTVCLSMTNVCFSYAKQPALNRVTFEARRGDILAILGPNGAGKTTLLKCLLKSLAPHEGSIEVLGRPLDALSAEEIGRLFSYVPQEVSMPFPYTVREVVSMGRYPLTPRFHEETREGHDRLEDSLARTRLSPLADRTFNDLSGGEKQRVLLARALAQEAPVMLLDEPTSSLDIRHAALVTEILLDVRKTFDRTILFVTHDLNLASVLADRVILMREGAVLASGDVSGVMIPEMIRAAYDTDVRTIADPETGHVFFFSVKDNRPRERGNARG